MTTPDTDQTTTGAAAPAGIRDADAAAGVRASGTTAGGGGRAAGAKAAGGFAVLALLFMSPALMQNGSYWLYLATEVLIYLLAAAGLNLILGYAGQISLAQAAFMGVGGYTVAILCSEHNWPMPLALLVGAAAGFALGLLVGTPALRVATHYLAMMTLGVQVIFQLVALNQTGLTGGALGMSGIPRPALGSLDLSSDRAFHVFTAIVVTLVLGALYFILRSTWGRAFKSIRENEMRAAMLGVNVRAYKLLAFAIGSAMAAIAGGLLASLVSYVDPDTFQINWSFNLLMMVVIGGRGRFEGPLLGTLLVMLLPEALRSSGNGYLIVFAVLTILVLMFMPKGLITLWDLSYRRVRGRPAPELTK